MGHSAQLPMCILQPRSRAARIIVNSTDLLAAADAEAGRERREVGAFELALGAGAGTAEEQRADAPGRGEHHSPLWSLLPKTSKRASQTNCPPRRLASRNAAMRPKRFIHPGIC